MQVIYINGFAHTQYVEILSSQFKNHQNIG